MKRKLVILGVSLLVVGAMALVLRPRGEPPRTWTEEVRVERGPVPSVMRELGVLAPRDPVLCKAPFTARLQWIVEDGTWVEAGSDLFILSDEDEIKRVADLRTQLVQARAEQRLAALKRQNGETLERPKLAAAERTFALAKVRRQLVEAKPVGGLELVRLAEALRPLAQATATARAEAERTQDAYQTALDAYLTALDAWQANRDRILRIQAKIDELEAGGAAEPGADAAKAEEERIARIASTKADAERERASAAGLASSLESARQSRDAAQQPRDAAAAALAAAEAAEAELRFKAEVEKRGLPLARLQLDARQAEVQLAETRRKVGLTKAAVEAGSLAKSELERLEDQLRRQENDLGIINARIAIESRPPDERTLAEADAELLQARTAAEDAKAAYDRAIALLDQDLALKKAQVERLDMQIEQRAAMFPAVIEAGIRFAEREIGLLGPEEKAEREDAERRLAALRTRYEAAKGSPPSTAKAPVAGLVRVMRNGDRPKQAGDQAWEQDALIEIYPPENMDVLLRVNEVDVRRLRNGLRAEVVVPALKDKVMRGEVVQLAGVGRDKFERPEYAGKVGYAGVVDFEVRLRLDGTEGVPLRQGMATRVSIDLGGQAEALRLPLAALTRHEDGSWTVLRRDGSRPVAVPVRGAIAGLDWFVVEDGVREGDTLVIERTRNR